MHTILIDISSSMSKQQKIYAFDTAVEIYEHNDDIFLFNHMEYERVNFTDLVSMNYGLDLRYVNMRLFKKAARCKWLKNGLRKAISAGGKSNEIICITDCFLSKEEESLVDRLIIVPINGYSAGGA